MKKIIFLLVALVGVLFLNVASARDYTVFVGYADGLRLNQNFPKPFADADIFQGNPNNVDAGAIRIQNTSIYPITLNDLTVTLNPNLQPVVFHLWNFGRRGITLQSGQNAVFTSTSSNVNTDFNFDTSDYGVLNQFNIPASINDNCSIGSTSQTALCIDNAPVVSVTVNGVMKDFRDTGHVLDTGGFDLAAANPCLLPTDIGGSCNESLQWRPIGSAGIQSASFGGTVTGVGLRNVVCQNMRTKRQITISNLKMSASWDCVSSGLVVKPGDVVKEILTGSVK